MNTGNLVCEAPVALPAGSPVVSPAPPDSMMTFSGQRTDASPFLPVLTLVLWLGCSVIAALGLAMPYARPHPARTQPVALKVEMLNVELSNDPLPDLEPPPANPLAVPPPAVAISQPQLPQAVAVAMPSPAIAFELPVKGPVRIVEAVQASHARSDLSNIPTPAAVAAQSLVFGQGAGKQPAPDYPVIAQDAGQEGTVKVRFFVAENGRVTAAEAVAPSPWPLLNDSAVRAIRNRWRFATGTGRVYQVVINFVLPK